MALIATSLALPGTSTLEAEESFAVADYGSGVDASVMAKPRRLRRPAVSIFMPLRRDITRFAQIVAKKYCDQFTADRELKDRVAGLLRARLRHGGAVVGLVTQSLLAH